MLPARFASTLVLLVRHGVTPTTGRLLPGRRRGLHLSEEGRRQAEALAVRLAAVPKLAAIYSSPLERARETVAPLAKARGLAVRVEPGLLESDLGAWTGLSLRRAAKRPEWAVVQRHASAFRFPGGASFVEMQARMVRALATYLAQILDKLPTASEPTPQSLDLVEPVDAAWPVASLGLGWDEKRQRIVVVAESVVDEEGEEPATARFAITRAQAAAFVERTESLVKAGRPICPMCSQPRDPAGHVCPRSNGHLGTA